MLVQFVAMRELVMVKLGGSLLTDKRRPRQARAGVIERLAREIASVEAVDRPPLVVGHGSGSFGHVEAARCGLAGGHGANLPTPSVAGVSAVQGAAALLHRLVIDAMAHAGLDPYSQAPSSLMVLDGGRTRRLFAEPLARALDVGLLPVIYGDVVVDRSRGAAIASTESVLRALIPRLRLHGYSVGRVLWMGATAGIHDAEGTTVPTVDETTFPAVRKLIGATAGTDVTGGMMLRLETAWALARTGVESWILDGTSPGLLAAALRGESVSGTHFLAS